MRRAILITGLAVALLVLAALAPLLSQHQRTSTRERNHT
jgi:hypothetical protein